MRFDIRDYVERKLDRAKPVAAQHSGEYTADCPSCEKSSKFYINVESGKFYCNSCKLSGRSVATLVAFVEQISYGKALAFVFRNSVELPRKGDLVTLRDRISMLRGDDDEDDDPDVVDVPLPNGFVPCYRDGRWRLPAYLRERKLKSKTIRAWGLGYCSEFELADGRTLEGQRIVVPIECPAGRSWTARATSDDVFGPKYFNPPGADHRRLLIGWNVMRFGGDVVICEGPFDALKLWQNKVPAVGIGGKVLHDQQMEQLATLPRSTAVTILLDPEELVAPHNVATKLSGHFKFVYVAKLPDGTDPGDASAKVAHAAVEQATLWTRRARLGDLLKSSRRRWSQ